MVGLRFLILENKVRLNVTIVDTLMRFMMVVDSKISIGKFWTPLKLGELRTRIRDQLVENYLSLDQFKHILPLGQSPSSIEVIAVQRNGFALGESYVRYGNSLTQIRN